MRRILSFVMARSPGVAALLVALGLVIVIACGAGIADIAKHGRKEIGTGSIHGRYRQTICSGNARECTTREGVHLDIDRANVTTTVDSSDLYDLVGEGDRHLPVRIEEDTFSHDVSRVNYGGRWYVISSPGKAALFIVIPLAVLGLALIALNAPPLARGARGLLTADGRVSRWILLAGGSLVAILCVVLAGVGLTDSGYDAGSGEVYGRYATFKNSNGYREGAHVHVDGDGTRAAVESSKLYDLLGRGGSALAVDVHEDSAGTITEVKYQGDTYRVSSPSWLALFIVVPVGLLALATAWLNGAALLRARRGREASAQSA